MKVAIMQPYIFPYIGYFQLVNSVDKFVFYDDVNFIKKGWINRNSILINNQSHLITFPCLKASQNKIIMDIGIDINSKEYVKIINTIFQAYKKAPQFNNIFPLIESVLKSKCKNISDLSVLSIKTISNYLNLETVFLNSSKSFSEYKSEDKADRLIQITKSIDSDHYVNAIGGTSLYDKNYFNKKGIQLNFLQPSIDSYLQFNKDFIPNLSIIDALMFNEIDTVVKMLNNYKLI